jgi:hypothetical protein
VGFVVAILGLLVAVSGLAGRSVARMTTSWDLSLSIESRGHGDTHVSVVPGVPLRSPHLKVRVGGVVVHCLDGAATMSAARAWANAHVQAGSWLPALRDPVRQPVPAGLGAAYPAGSIILEGRQAWQVSHSGHALDITVGPLRVRVHDMTALDTHVRAWSQASAVALRTFPGKALPFARLVEQERYAPLRAAEAAAERRRAQLSRLQPSTEPPGRDLGRGRD